MPSPDLVNEMSQNSDDFTSPQPKSSQPFTIKPNNVLPTSSPKREEVKKSASNLAAAFEQSIRDEDDERMVKLTASEELLSSPDRRSLRQKKLAERFTNSLAMDDGITVENTEEVKSDSQSSSSGDN